MYREILIFCLIGLVACQPEPVDVPYRLELRTLQLEVSILNQDKELISLLSDEVSELYKEQVRPEGSDLEKFDNIIFTIQKTALDDTEFTHLQKLKELIVSIPISLSPRDEHLDALLVFGNDLLVTTETARDPMMDLYEWNEFMAQIESLKDSWKLLEDRKPTVELLRFNPIKIDSQMKLFDLLRQSINVFFESVENEEATTYDLCSNSDVLRQQYINYLSLLTSVSPQDQEEILQ